MMKSKRVWIIIAVVLWAALLTPFFLGAPAAHPATDDFTFAAYTHPTWVKTGSIVHVLKDAVSYALRTWRDWQGTVTGVIIMTLNPIVFSLPHYGVHAVMLLLLNLLAWFVFLRHMLCARLGIDRSLYVGLYLALSAMLLLFLPDMVEGIYWFNGAWFYMGAQAAALLTLTLCDVFSVMSGRRKTITAGVLGALLLFALGMDNYITAMMTAAALFMMGVQRIWAFIRCAEEEKALQKRAALRTLLLLLPIGAGLLLSVIAPGNAVRMERDGAHQSGLAWLMMSILWTMRDAAWYVVRFSFKTPLFALLASVTPALCRSLAEGSGACRRKSPPVWATAAGVYLVLCAMIIPHMYSSGNSGSGRVVNMYHCYVLTALPIAWLMILTRLAPGTRVRFTGEKAKKTCEALGALALGVCLLLGQGGNYAKLVSDQLSGVQDAYIVQFENEYALCEAGGEGDDVVIPAWTVQTVTGKPTAYEDKTMWTNESMAQYFGIRSVQVQK